MAAGRLVVWETKSSPFMWSSQAHTEPATTVFPFLCSQLASALLLKPSSAENK